MVGEIENIGKRRLWSKLLLGGICCNQRPSASPTAGNLFSQSKEEARTHLCDTLLMLPPEQDGPRDATRVLALQEEGLGFAVLEAKDLAIAADVEFTLDYMHESAGFPAQSGSLCRWEGLLLLLMVM